MAEPMFGVQVHVVAGRPARQRNEYRAAVNAYEITVRGRLSPALVEATGTDSAHFAAGLTTLVADNYDQARLHSLFSLLRDLNITLVSVNALETA